MFDKNNLKINEDNLLFILEYILDNIDCNIINLSLGLSLVDNVNVLQGICNRLEKKRIIVIAGHENDGAISYPAAFENVIGVITGENCHKKNEFDYVINSEIVNICANGNVQRVWWNDPDYFVSAGNSFACAHVTGIASNLYEENMPMNDLLFKMKNLSKNIYTFPDYIEKNSILPKYEKVSIFPFNKEMHSLVRFKNLLNFEIIDIYDSKYSGNIGVSTNHLLKTNIEKDYIIKNIENINWDSIDTIILGHTDSLIRVIEQDDFMARLIQEGIQRKKFIYSLDDITSYLNVENNADILKNVYYPHIKQINVPVSQFGMLHRNSKPVLGIFGTSSQQGKFTLQLYLREIFIKNGYHIGQIGTEPTALLYGMDDCFHFGYNSNIEVNRHDTVSYLNKKIFELTMQDTDIILIGSQSFILPNDNGNLDNYSFAQMEFLLATQPDAVILCINPFDDMEYIDRTVRFLESSVNCKVIAFVVFPMDIKNENKGLGYTVPLVEDKYVQLKQSLHNKFQTPIFKLGDTEDINILFDVILNFFS